MADQQQNLLSNMEQKITERTAQLQKNVTELNRMNTLMVDRELKMIELKKEIERLKKEK